MDMRQIASIHSSMRCVNLNGGTSFKEVESVVENQFNCSHCYDTGQIDCSNCDGKGYIQDYEDRFQCGHCQEGKNICPYCDIDLEKNASGNWAVDEMDFPSEETFMEGIGREYPQFKPGDQVEYCGDVATVVRNYDSEVVVDLGGGVGTCVWRKFAFGSPVTLVKKANEGITEGDGGDKLDPTIASGQGALVSSIGKQQDEFFPEQEMWGVDYTGNGEHTDTSDNEDAAVEPGPEDMSESKNLKESSVEIPREREEYIHFLTLGKKIAEINREASKRNRDGFKGAYDDENILTAMGVEQLFISLGWTPPVKRATTESSMRSFIDKMDEIVNEVAPTDQEAWVKKNKSKFKKEYGDKKGEEVLYATAWKKHNKDKK